ncbi:MAG TPA: hypothetical protein PK466_07840 [Thermotogota bacterium]|nr:hypothetical protein [Thermotogota bacterium]HPJ88041.1 hypothetical protein [Thermotogota bacterium]HPR96226.1 hypothetical protein [Thermotogota bacterium]
MISAAAYAQNIPLKATPADKKIQNSRLNELLRRINRSENKAELLMKYQYLNELVRGSKTSEIGHFIDKLASELSVDEKQFKKLQPQLKKENNFVNCKQFKKLFPRGGVLFEFNNYGVAAREELREIVTGRVTDTTSDFFPIQTYFKKRAALNGLYVESYDSSSFDGLKGEAFDYYF